MGCIAASNPTKAGIVFRAAAMASFESVIGTGELAGAEPDPSSDATETRIEWWLSWWVIISLEELHSDCSTQRHTVTYAELQSFYDK